MKSKPIIIGLSGYAGTGKDTVRKILESAGFVGFAFADPIRSMLRELLTSNGISDQFIDSREFKEQIIPELGVSYRQMAQTLGTEWGRALQPDFWLRLAGSYIADVSKTDGELFGHLMFVISDVRFANEAAWVREQGGVIWRVVRTDTTPVRSHVSEQELTLFDADRTIINDGSLEELHLAVLQAVGGLQ